MPDTAIRQMVFSVPEGGEVVTVFPQPLTPETIDMLEECYAIMFRGMRRMALKVQAFADADAEYESWFAAMKEKGTPHA
jgi:hypothetical protein